VIVRLLSSLPALALACADPVVADGVDPDGSDTEIGPDSDPAPVAERPAVVVNELMASNQGALVVDGATPDWLELHNRSDAEVSLAGWTIEDAGSGPIALGDVAVPAGGFLVLYADDGGAAPSEEVPPIARHARAALDEEEEEHSDDDDAGEDDERWRHLPFKLSRQLDRVVLTDLAGRADTLGFDVLQAEDFSLARVPDGCDLPECLRRVHLGTPGASNGSAP
jgi:hypothetical protein